MHDDLENTKGNGWIDGVGEGRSDEANLSAYFRMSEGDDNDNSSAAALTEPVRATATNASTPDKDGRRRITMPFTLHRRKIALVKPVRTR